MKYYKILFTIVACAILASVIPQVADGAGVTYSNRRKQIHAGVAVLRNYPDSGFPAGGAKANAYPYVFYVMDRRADMKPRGWEFINPLAPAQVQKNTVAYWAVDLEQVSLQNLTRLDVLYICADSSVGNPLRFPMNIRDKLRQFIDSGGVLWFDNPRVTGGQSLVFDSLPANVFFLDGVNNAEPGGTTLPWVYERHHPLVTSPFWITTEDAAYMGLDSQSSQRYFIRQSSPPDLPPIITLGNDTSKAYVGAVEYGSGKIVFTSGGIGGELSPPDWASLALLWPEPNDFDMMRVSRPSSLKMAYNIVNWASSYSGFRKNARHSGFAPEGISTGHVEKWRFPMIPPSGTETGVAILKDVFFYVGGGKLWALDGVPEADLDSDGNANDGDTSEPPGSTYDVIWSADVGDASAPVAFTAKVKDDTLECVMVQTRAGDVMVFRAFPSDASRLSGTADLIGGFSTAGTPGTGKLYPPTFFNNYIFAAAGDGSIYGIEFQDMLSGASPWYVPRIVTTNTPYTRNPLSGAPTVGFVEHKTNGALVAMVFAMAEPNATNNVTPNDYVMGVPIFVSGERLSKRDTKSRWTFLTAYSQATPGWQEGTEPKGTLIELDPLKHIVIKDRFGNNYTNYTVVGVNAMTDSSGALIPDVAPGKIVIKQLDGDPIPDSCQVYVTYSLKYTDTGSNSINPRVYHSLPPRLPSTSGARVRVTATPAMGPSGTMFVSTAEDSSAFSSPGSSIYSLTYQGGERGDSMTTDWVYRLANWDFSYGPDVVERWGFVAPDPTDPTGKALLPLSGLRFSSSPAVAKGKVFATVSGADSTTGIKGGALLAFKEKSDFVIRVNQSSSQASFVDTTTGHPRNIRIWQPDPTNPMGNPVIEAATVPSSMLDRDSGTITIKDFSSNNLVMRRGATGSQTLVPLTPALPVSVLVNNVVLSADQIDSSSWDNLLWYYPIVEHENPDGTKTPCTGIDSPPTVIGDRVYFVCNDGWLYSIDASPGLSKHSRLSDNNKVQKKYIGGLGGGICQSVSASNGLLAVVTSEGLCALDNPITLIGDANRAIEIDGNGEPMWACDALVVRDTVPGATLSGQPMSGLKKESINRPSRVRSFGPSDYLIVNSGSDQVVRMTRSGDVTAIVKTFTDNYKHLLKSGEPLQLRGPTDATIWAENENGEYIYHWLIADAGNYRVVDLIYRFNRDGARVVRNPSDGTDVLAASNAPPELNWVSLSTDIGRNYRFNSAQIVNNGTEIWVAAGNWTVGEKSYGTPGGSIVKFNYRERIANGWKYVPGTVMANGQIDTILSENGVLIKLSNPRYLRIFDVYEGGVNTWHALICESRGVFETDSTGRVVWSLTNKDTNVNLGGHIYQDLIRSIGDTLMPYDLSVVKLDAAYVQRLPNNDLLITNSHSESDAEGNKFGGEVFQVTRPTSGSPRITWYAPQVIKTSTGQLKQKMIGTYNLTQPMSAERVY